MLIGTGKYSFDVNHDFARLPRTMQLGYTHGVVVDEQDNVFIFNQSKDAVIKLTPNGEFDRSWGEEFAEGAHGMFLAREKHHAYLYLTDYVRHEVVKTTPNGEVQFRIGCPPRKDIYASSEEFKPTDVAVAPSGDIYVFDGYGKPYVHIYDTRGIYRTSIGGPGNGPGQLNCPHAGWVDTRKTEPELYVADRGNNRMQIFTLDGKHKRFVTHPELKQPCDFYQYGNELFVPDLQARVSVWDENDQLLAVLGDNPEAPGTAGWPNIQDKLKPGKFNSPHGLCVDSKGDVYVVEWISTGRITKMIRKGDVPVTQEPRAGRYT